MSEDPEAGLPGPGRPWIRLVAAGALVAGVGLWTLSEGPVAPSAPPPAPPSPRADSSRLPAADRGEITLAQGRELRVAGNSIDRSRSLALLLALPPDAPDIGIKSVWLYGEGQEPTRIASKRPGPGQVRVEIAPEFLTPGRHIVELRTDELTAIPLRRYSFEIF